MTSGVSGEVPPHPCVLRLRGSKFMCLRNSVYKILKEMKTSLGFWDVFDVISGCTKLRLYNFNTSIYLCEWVFDLLCM